MVLITVLFILLLGSVCGENDTYLLKMTHLLFRHGARTPIIFFPNNRHINDWHVGPGMLTKVGMNMEYELGIFLKQRYMEELQFLNESYIEKEIYIRSSDSPRCLQSAEVQLAGLYPPKGHQIWNDRIRTWQPIPVHTIPQGEDSVLRSTNTPCPRLVQMLTEKRMTNEYHEMEKKYEPFMSLLSNYTGMTINMRNVWIVYDVLKCEEIQGFRNDWPAEIRAQLMELGDWLFYNNFYGDDELARVLGGVLLHLITKNMEHFSVGANQSTLYKMNMFSGHDTSLLSLASALNVDLSIPTFASCFMVELYEDNNGSFFVEMRYRNDTSGNLYLLRLRQCGFKCPLPNFIRLTSLRRSEFQECGVGPGTATARNRKRYLKAKRSMMFKRYKRKNLFEEKFNAKLNFDGSKTV